MTFRISEDMLKERKKLIFIMICSMPIMMTGFFFLSASQGSGIKNIPLALMIIGGISAFLVLEMVIVGKIMFKKIRSLTINFDEKGFTRINGKKTERFEFDDMTHVKIVKKDTNPQKMMIRGKCSKKAFILGGFENMSQMHTLFETSVTTIDQKEQKIDWSSPKIMIAVMVLSAAVMAMFILIDGNIVEYISPLIQVLFGVYLITFKPISKSSGARFKVLEIILGGLLLVAGGGVLIIKILGL